MEARIDVITLAIASLDRALAFYRDGLGLETPGVVATELVGDDVTPAGALAMFKLPGLRAGDERLLWEGASWNLGGLSAAAEFARDLSQR